MAKGDVVRALITAMKASQMGPRILNLKPRRPLESLTNLMIKAEDKNPPAGYETTRTLAATMHRDMQSVVDMAGEMDRLEVIERKVLLLGGSKSPRYLRHDLDELQVRLTCAHRSELANLGHVASWNSDRGGNPEPVANELKRFFGPRQKTH